MKGFECQTEHFVCLEAIGESLEFIELVSESHGQTCAFRRIILVVGGWSGVGR